MQPDRGLTGQCRWRQCCRRRWSVPADGRPPRPAQRTGRGCRAMPPALPLLLLPLSSGTDRAQKGSAERQGVQRGAPASLCCWCCSDATRLLSCWAAWRSDMAAPCLLSVPAAMGLGVAGSLLARWWLGVCLSVRQQIGRQGVALQPCRRAQHALQAMKDGLLCIPCRLCRHCDGIYALGRASTASTKHGST